eukprot:147255-Rhodomonas_salina.1
MVQLTCGDPDQRPRPAAYCHWRWLRIRQDQDQLMFASMEFETGEHTCAEGRVDQNKDRHTSIVHCRTRIHVLGV